MGRKGLLKLSLASLALLSLVLLNIGNAWAVLTDDKEAVQKPAGLEDNARERSMPDEPGRPEEKLKEAATPEYAPGELIVKLKEGKTLEDIQGLNAKYNVTSQDKVFKDAPSPEQTLQSLKDKLAALGLEHDKWYWQLDKNSQEYKEYAAKIEKERAILTQQISAQEELIAQLEQRQKRAPEGALAPALENIYLLKAKEEADIPQMAAEYKNNPAVEYAEPNYIARTQAFPQTLPNDTYVDPEQNGAWSTKAWGQGYEDMWGLKKIQADKAWPISQGEAVIVAVIDTGVNYNHPDLKENIWINTREVPGNGIDDDNNGFIDDVYGYDFAYSDPDPMDAFGHGTHVAGTIAAVGNNSQGVIGVAPKARLMAVKGLSDGGSGYSSDLANCIRYAVDNGASVLSNSWGGPGSPQLLTDAFAYAWSKGCVAIASAGNANNNARYYSPANIDTVIAVAASTQNDEKCSFSNWGPKIEISAPGGGYYGELGGGGVDRYNILSTMPDDSYISRNYPDFKISNGYWRLAGTSMACPHVAGVAALIISKYPSLTNDEVRQTIQGSSDDIGEEGKDDSFGYGRINAYKAVTLNIYISFGRFMRARQNIIGSASLIEGFQRYELWYAPKDSAQDAVLITSSATPVKDGLLGVWDTNGVSDGEYILALKVIDRNNKESKITKDVTIDNISQPPQFKNLSNKGAVIGRLFEFKVEASDPDDPDTPWGRLRYAAGNLPPGAQFNPLTQVFSWQPSIADKGIYQVSFTARDNEHTVTQNITLSTVYIEETQISTNPGGQYFPVIYADKIVYGDLRNNYPPGSGYIDISMYDLSTRQETQITTDAEYYQEEPAIYADKIVWKGYRNRCSGIYMYDLSTRQETQITPDVNIQYQHPAIYEDKIVWGDWRNGNADIYMYDLSTRQETQITTNARAQYSPSIYADKIVWVDYRNGKSDIYMYDLSTRQETQITTDAEYQGTPSIYADKIVWYDCRNGNADIYMYDLSTRQETQVTNNLGGQYVPVIYEDKIVWIDDRNGSPHIYMATMFFVPQIINLSPATVSPGLLVTINGKEFGYTQGDSQVEFANGVIAPVESWSNSQITCKIPDEAVSGLLKVVTKGGKSNGVEITVFTPGPANLIVTGIKFYQPRTEIETKPMAGELVTCKAILINQGGEPTGIFNVKWFLDGAQVGYGSHASLSPGQISQDNVRYDWLATPGKHVLEFVADCDNRIPESDKMDNFFIRKIRLWSKITSVSGPTLLTLNN